MSNIPSPSVMQRFAPKTKVRNLPVVIAQTEPEAPASGLVRPGLREQVVEVLHDGVIKAKTLKSGQKVRAFLHGAPRGGERTVSKVTRSQDGATVIVEFSSPHPTTEYKAAYRFYDATLVDTVVRHIEKVPALVAYEEV
jgi:hypothetical protein